MWQGELETRFQQLLDIRTADVCTLLNLDNADNLIKHESGIKR